MDGWRGSSTLLRVLNLYSLQNHSVCVLFVEGFPVDIEFSSYYCTVRLSVNNGNHQMAMHLSQRRLQSVGKLRVGWNRETCDEISAAAPFSAFMAGGHYITLYNNERTCTPLKSNLGAVQSDWHFIVEILSLFN